MTYKQEVSQTEYDSMVELVNQVAEKFPNADRSSLQYWLKHTTVVDEDAKLKRKILDTVSDTMAGMLYYDRKEDDVLPVHAIERAIQDGVVTVDEILEVVKRNLVQ